MRRRRIQDHTVDFLFTISLFCVFAVCALLVVSTGVQAYRSTALYLEDTYSARTALSYVAEKIRQHDAAGRVALTQLDGVNAVLLTDVLSMVIFALYNPGEVEFVVANLARDVLMIAIIVLVAVYILTGKGYIGRLSDGRCAHEGSQGESGHDLHQQH